MISIVIGCLIFIASMTYVWIKVVEPRVPGGVFTNGNAYEARQKQKEDDETRRTQWRIKVEERDYGWAWSVARPGGGYYIHTGTVFDHNDNRWYKRGVDKKQVHAEGKDKAELEAKAYIRGILDKERREREAKIIYVKDV